MAHKKKEINEEETKEKCENKKCECGCENGSECLCENTENDENKVKEDDKELAEQYLNMARVIQADFDNFRKRAQESIASAKIDGMISAIEVILPCIDVFKKAEAMVTDENALKGIKMVENEIQNALVHLGVEKIDCVGKKFNPNLHYALSIIEDKTKEDDTVLEEFQVGYKFKDKVIKYSQVIVNKIKEEK